MGQERPSHKLSLRNEGADTTVYIPQLGVATTTLTMSRSSTLEYIQGANTCYTRAVGGPFHTHGALSKATREI